MRLPERLGPRRTTLGVGALVVSGLAVAQALSSLLPPVNDVNVYGEGVQRPFERRLDTDVDAQLRTGTIHLGALATGARVETPDMLVTASPGATFLTVAFDFVPSTRVDTIGTAWLDDDQGRRFVVDSGSDKREGVWCERVGPGLTARCAAVFELPGDAISPSSRVTLSPNGAGDPYDDAAVLVLGDRAPTLVARSADTTPVQLHVGVLGKDL